MQQSPRASFTVILLVAFWCWGAWLPSKAVSGGLGQFPAQNFELQSWLTLTELRPGATSASGIWGYVAPSGREYAIIGVNTGTVFVEVTNPVAPAVVGFVSGPPSEFRDIKTHQQYAYVVSEDGSGIQVVDLVNIDSQSVDLINTVLTDDIGNPMTRSVAIDTVSGFLYRFGGSSTLPVGVRAYDLSVPTAAAFAGGWHTRYIHDGQAVTYDDGPYAGKQIAFCCSANTASGSSSGLDILDVTDKSSIVSLARLQYAGAQFSHHLSLSHDRRYVYLSDEGVPAAVFVIDVAELENPSLAATFTNGNPARSHNLFVRGSLVFASNQRSGLRVFSVTEPTQGVEIAYLDTHPESDSASPSGHAGQWSNFPFLPSATILCSDFNRGLFMGRLDLLVFHYPDGRPGMARPNEPIPLTVKIDGPGLPPDTSSVVLHYRILDGPMMQVPMVHLGANQFSATLPPIGCDGGYIDYHVSADALQGATFTDPPDAPSKLHRAFVLGTDDFELDYGWTVSGNATDGHWERGIPVNCGRGDPPADYDGSGSCWLTDNSAANNCNSDVDGGATILTSPLMDMAGGGTITYAYWFNNHPTGPAGAGDNMTVEMSTNQPATNWTLLRTYTTTMAAWRTDTIEVGAEIAATAHMRIRFTVRDTNPGHVIEGGLDAFHAERTNCGVPGDADGDGDVDLDDYEFFSDCFAGPGASPAPVHEDMTSAGCLVFFDFDEDGDVDLADFAWFASLLAQ